MLFFLNLHFIHSPNSMTNPERWSLRSVYSHRRNKNSRPADAHYNWRKLLGDVKARTIISTILAWVWCGRALASPRMRSSSTVSAFYYIQFDVTHDTRGIEDYFVSLILAKWKHVSYINAQWVLRLNKTWFQLLLSQFTCSSVHILLQICALR